MSVIGSTSDVMIKLFSADVCGSRKWMMDADIENLFLFTVSLAVKTSEFGSY